VIATGSLGVGLRGPGRKKNDTIEVVDDLGGWDSVTCVNLIVVV
jgi:hypothetical protein